MNTTLVVAVSGGCDSMALLHVLVEAQAPKLQVVHFDHRQRGEESDKDRNLVQETADRFQLPFTCFSWDSNGTFSQDSARQWRRKHLNEVARQYEPARVVTAHHADDRDEGLLLQMLRGTHITQVHGMGATRVHDGIVWWRPFLDIRKANLVEYLQENGLEWREDASNQSPKYMRNRVRNDLVPLLQELVGGDSALQRRLSHFTRQSREVDEFLRPRVEERLNLFRRADRLVLPELVDLIDKMVLYEWIQQQTYGMHYSYDQFERVCSQVKDYPNRREWSMNLGDGWNIVRQGDAFRMEKDDGATTQAPRHQLKHKVLDDSCDTSDNLPRIWMHRSAEPEDVRFSQTLVSEVPDLRILPPWKANGGSMKVTDFLRGQQIPLHERMDAPVIVVEQQDGSQALVAVYVSTKDMWMLDADYYHEGPIDPEKIVLSLSR